LAYPTYVRAFGTGFMIGFGRGGSVLSPILVGFLLEMKMALSSAAMLMAIGSLVGAVVLSFLKLKSGDPSHGSHDTDEEKKALLEPSVA
jgi:hypothetical protein